GELGEVVRLLERGDEGLAHPGAVVAGAEGGLQLGLQYSERGPKLVAGVRHEPALSLKRFLQPGQHLVERLAEAADLVLRRRERQSLAAAAEGDPLGPLAHRLNRREPRGGEQVADPGSEE